MLLWIQLREYDNSDSDFQEWGSAIAHQRRNQGIVWEAAVSAWATQSFYAKLVRVEPILTPLPSDVINAMLEYIENLTDQQVQYDFSDLFPGGIEREELYATLSHHYSYAKKDNRKRERDAFYHLCSSGGMPDADQQLISRLIFLVEDKALDVPPLDLNNLISSVETFLNSAGILKTRFNKDDRVYLQLHALAAFHAMQLKINDKVFKDLTGEALDGKEPIVFVSSMDSLLSLDVGFFELEDQKYLEPVEFFGHRRPSKLYYPIVQSDLDEELFLWESDQNIRVCLYNHPIEVVSRMGHFGLIAHNREAARYSPTKSRYSQPPESPAKFLKELRNTLQ